ncbi:hypothetical protein BDM02DRAFT_3117896, partial [Thelephora ganbajun]
IGERPLLTAKISVGLFIQAGVHLGKVIPMAAHYITPEQLDAYTDVSLSPKKEFPHPALRFSPTLHVQGPELFQEILMGDRVGCSSHIVNLLHPLLKLNLMSPSNNEMLRLTSSIPMRPVSAMTDHGVPNSLSLRRSRCLR